MAVSYRLVIFLIVILVGAFFWGISDAAVNELDEQINGEMDTDQGSQLYGAISTMWLVAPLIILIAAGAWALKQSILSQI